MGRKKKNKGFWLFNRKNKNKDEKEKVSRVDDDSSRSSRKNRDNDAEQLEMTFWGSLKQETTEAIVAIFFIVFSIFLMLSPFSKAGPVGTFTYGFLNKLFGIGYYLIPIILTVLAVYYIGSYKKNMSWRSSIGAGLLMLSSIGLLHIIPIYGGVHGGIIGSLVGGPLYKLFDIWVSFIILVSIFLVSILVIFNTSINCKKIFSIFRRKHEDDEDDYEDEIEVSVSKDDDEKSNSKSDAKSDTRSDSKKDAKSPSDQPVKIAAQDNSDSDKKDSKKTDGLFFFSKKTNKDSEYRIPPISLLDKDSGKPVFGDIKANANIIRRTLMNFGIQVEMDEVSVGPSVTRYALKPAEGVKLSKIVALQNDLSLALAAHPLRIEAPIPGKSLVGIEIPNTTKTKVGLGTMLKQPEFTDSDKPLLLGMGKGVTGKSYFANLGKAPHMLIAGATGSGKSVTIHTLVISLLYRNSPEMLKFIMVDPKRVELTLYNKIPHLLTPVITDPKKTILALRWAAKEMNRRYDVLQEHGVRDIESYHKNVLEPALKKAGSVKGSAHNDSDLDGEVDAYCAEMPETMPFMVIIIDELADIMQTYPRELEAGIVKLAQMSRAVGIHLIISTQRPSVNVITGLIKANIPTRVALQVASQIDSRTILDMPGAEKLLGQGDMLYLGGEMSQPVRVQSAFISEEEVKKVVDFLADQYKDELPESDIDLEGVNNKVSIFDAMSGGGDGDESDEDDLYSEAKAVVLEAGKASTSYLQRKLGIGYSRAAKIIDLLEEKGVVGPSNGSKPREVIAGGGGNESGDDSAGDDGDDYDSADDSNSDDSGPNMAGVSNGGKSGASAVTISRAGDLDDSDDDSDDLSRDDDEDDDF